jgi:hypothetical protein
VPPTQCVACKTPAIDAATRDQSRANRAIARDFKISEAAVRRHRANHVTDPASAAHAEQPAASRRPGRPSKFTDQRVQRLLAAIRAGNTTRAACHYAGIGVQTLADWQRQHRDFREALEKAEADAEVRMVAEIVQAVRGGTWQAAAWWLERRRADDYGRRDRVDVELRLQLKRLAAELELSEQDILAEAERLVAPRR